MPTDGTAIANHPAGFIGIAFSVLLTSWRFLEAAAAAFAADCNYSFTTLSGASLLADELLPPGRLPAAVYGLGNKAQRS